MTIHGPGIAASVGAAAVGTVVAVSYTSGEVLLILAAVGTLVTIIGGQIVTIIVTIRAHKETSRKVEENTILTAAVAEKTAVIEHATNGAMTKAEEIIKTLREQIRFQEAARDELARAAADVLKEKAGIITPK
jgi:hypothetical protein